MIKCVFILLILSFFLFFFLFYFIELAFSYCLKAWFPLSIRLGFLYHFSFFVITFKILLHLLKDSLKFSKILTFLMKNGRTLEYLNSHTTFSIWLSSVLAISLKKTPPNNRHCYYSTQSFVYVCEGMCAYKFICLLFPFAFQLVLLELFSLLLKCILYK